MGVLESWPELAVFLTVGLAYTFGKLKLGKLPLGTVMAALLLGLVFGHLTHVEPSRELRWAFFLMFLFANGYMAGPQFSRGMESGGWKALVLSLVVATTGLAATYGCARLLALDPGMAAGLFSGALTSTAAMGTAVDAIRALDLPDEGRHALASQVFIANALTYAGGAMGIVAFVTKLAPPA